MPEIIDPTSAATPPKPPALSLGGRAELEILAGRRCFAVAQELFSGSAIAPAQQLEVGWHDSSVNPETGSFAVVAPGAGLDDLIGEIVAVTLRKRQVFAYVLGWGDIPTPFSLTRRLFAALSVLTVENVTAAVAAVQ